LLTSWGGVKITVVSLLQFLDLETRGQRLLQLLGLLLVGDLQGVQEPGASDLELGVVGVLLDLDALGVLPARLQQEVLDLLDLTRHLRFCKHFHVFNSM